MIRLKPDCCVAVLDDDDVPKEKYRAILLKLGVPDAQILSARTKLEIVNCPEPIACLLADIEVFSGTIGDPSPADRIHGLDAIRQLINKRKIDAGQVVVVSRFIEHDEVRETLFGLGIDFASNVFRRSVGPEALATAITKVLKRFNWCM
jgi:hypothetical protein